MPTIAHQGLSGSPRGRVGAAALALAALGIVGCSEAEPSRDPSADTLSAESTSGEQNTHAAAPSSGAFAVTVSQAAYRINEQEVTSWSVSAKVDAAGASTACTTTADQGCTITECALGGDPAAPGVLWKAPDASGIEIRSAKRTFTLDPDRIAGTYPLRSGQDALFEGGTDLAVTGSGAEVPAFGTSLRTPATVTLVTPSLDPGFAVQRSGEFPIAWTGGDSGEVVATITSTQGSRSATISCVYPATAGSASIPKTALAKLVAGDGTISVTSRASQTVNAKGWAIAVSVLAPARAGAASAYSAATIY